MTLGFFPLFLQATLTSILSGAALWYLLQGAARRWPALAAARRIWLLAQIVIAAAFVAVLLPGSAGFSLLPAIELSAATPSTAAGADGVVDRTAQADHVDALGVAPPSAAQTAGAELPVAAVRGAAARSAESHGPASAGSRGLAAVLPLAGQAWLAIYISGLLATAIRWLRVRRLLASLLAAARALDARTLRLHPGFAREDGAALLGKGLRVVETNAPVSPMLLGCIRPRLLLPEHLRAMDPAQQELIVAHELTHWRRRDQLCLHLSLVLQTLFWFNPFFSLLREKLALAQELACDRQVLAGRPLAQHKNYAAALLGQLKVQQQSMQSSQYASLAFGGDGMEALGLRIRLIRQPLAARLDWAGRISLGTGLCALLAASILLQPAFAWRMEAVSGAASGVQPSAAGDAADAADAAAGDAAVAGSGKSTAQWRKPLRDGRVSSFFGVPRKSAADGRPMSDASIHHGVDFAARTGTQVLAVADGVVAESTDLYAGQEKYGKVVVIEHADGLRSLYAHLDRRSVRPGQSVKAGQPIALSGASGRVTGPHLHLEALRNGRHIDPQTLIADLEQGAFKTALRKRDAANATSTARRS